MVLDFLLAAGLLRLSVDASWQALAVTAIVIAVRRVVTLGLTHPAAHWLDPRRVKPSAVRTYRG